MKLSQLDLIAFLSFVTLATPRVLSADPPFNAALVGHWDEFGGTYAGLWADDHYAYVGTYTLEEAYPAQVLIIDISDPSTPTLASTFFVPTPNEFCSAQEVKIANGIMYVAYEFSNTSDDVGIVDVRDPANPVLLGTISLNAVGTPHNLYYADGYLYIVDSSTTRIAVVDLTEFDPDRPPAFPITKPKWVIQSVGDNIVHDAIVQNGRLFASAYNAGIWVYDTSDVSTQIPSLMGWIDGTATHSMWPTEDGKYLAVAEEREGGDLDIYELVESEGEMSFVYKAAGDAGSDSYCIHNPIVIGHRAYSAWYQAGLQVHDIDRETGVATLRASYDTSDEDPAFGYEGAWSVYPYLGSDRILISDMQNGLFIIETPEVECTSGPDCDADGTSDACEIEHGFESDCDLNGQPDPCDTDCDSNGVPDSCDILNGNADDCNGDQMIDDCESHQVLSAPGSGMGKSMAINGDWLLVGAAGDTTLGPLAGAARFYKREGDAFVEKQFILASDGDEYDYFGWSVAMENNMAAVGAWTKESDNGFSKGAVYIYENSEDTWTQTGQVRVLTGDGTADFGYAVGIWSNFLFVGARVDDEGGSDVGAVFIFERKGSDWDQIDKLVPGIDCYTGTLLTAGDGYLAVRYSGAGCNYVGVHTYDGKVWPLQQVLVPDVPDPLVSFGSSIAIEGNRIAVGVIEGNDLRGVVYCFFLQDGAWIQEAAMASDALVPESNFGNSVDLSGSTLLVGAPYQPVGDIDAGSAYVFQHDGMSWQEMAQIVPKVVADNQLFGEQVLLQHNEGVLATEFEEIDSVTYLAELLTDCNANGIQDECDIFAGWSSDCNANDLPDECDLLNGTSFDIDADGVPDECGQFPSCTGDVNNDGAIDPLDSGFILLRLGCIVNKGDADCDAADVNGDGIVDPLDAGFVLSRLGSKCE